MRSWHNKTLMQPENGEQPAGRLPDLHSLQRRIGD